MLTSWQMLSQRILLTIASNTPEGTTDVALQASFLSLPTMIRKVHRDNILVHLFGLYTQHENSRSNLPALLILIDNLHLFSINNS